MKEQGGFLNGLQTRTKGFDTLHFLFAWYHNGDGWMWRKW